jgi:tRNA threonylcarbamoyl adenosine modification protein YjeE
MNKELHNNFTNVDLNTIQKITKKIALNLKIGDAIFLHGPLGVGKTTFTQMLINNLHPKTTEVTSPTFNIVHQYPNKNNITIWHFDLYRIKYEEELEHLGFEDATINGISIIEWPEILKDHNFWSPTSIINIYLNFIEENNSDLKNNQKNDTIRNLTITYNQQ